MRNFANYRLQNSSCEISRRMLKSALYRASSGIRFAFRNYAESIAATFFALATSCSPHIRGVCRSAKKAANTPNS